MPVESVLLLIVIIGGGLWFLKENKRRGILTVRAHVFLTALDDGKSVQEANFLSRQFNPDAIPKKLLVQTFHHVEDVYARKQMWMIKSARKKGMED
ncbi:MAG: hypothetical protein AAF940_04540 [Pseudomonadota bacterium]